MSGVAVATITKSIVEGSRFFFSRSCFAACIAKKEVGSSGFRAILRSLIPVRVTIHSSFVSTIFSKSVLDKTSEGT
jgi:hypothetical protein